MQLSSLVKWKPKNVEVHFTLCTADTDDRSLLVFQKFLEFLPNLRLRAMKKQDVWRRAIGRNRSTFGHRSSEFDLVWFADCDYLFGEGCLDALLEIWEENERPALMWPGTYLANWPDKRPLDEFIKQHENTAGLLMPDLSTFVSRKCPRAVGGVQIASGKYCEKHGYLQGTKWMEPVETPFPDFRDDIHFRETAFRTGAAAKIILPNVYRLRHTDVGYGSETN